MTNHSRDIMCKNTLDIRVQQSFADSLPDIRAALFGTNEDKAKK